LKITSGTKVPGFFDEKSPQGGDSNEKMGGQRPPI
jgi:hypothetical protein